MKTLDESTFDYLSPTSEQIELMIQARKAAAKYADLVDELMPDGPDKTYTLRKIREVAMWVNIGITRHPDGKPRS